ncbi:MAG: hypothetical protein GYB55_10465 [Cytophagales bacterium]|nr:hypothetical protein [Cytophagales bacterium]|tara:strand:+ start:40894 stop:43194 length:2301 start_codon:yes stop_codon:yes gene_type:complete
MTSIPSIKNGKPRLIMNYFIPYKEPRFWLIYLFVFIINNTFSQTHTNDAKFGQAFHLSVKPWDKSKVDKNDFLELIEATCEVMAINQNPSGAIIDPYLKREHQYSTPYFAFAVGVLLKAGKGKHLKAAGIKAMEHSTLAFSKGSKAIPDEHGEFFISPLTNSLQFYKNHVSQDQFKTWTERMRTPLEVVMQNFDGRINNWRTYAMKGEWNRVNHKLSDKSFATEFIETAWNQYSQKIRIVNDKWNMYQDWSSDPQSLAVEAVGRGNLIALATEGYDGPSSPEIWKAFRKGTYTSLYTQSPDGQAPPNGRTDNHIFNDVLYQLAFEVMAEDAWKNGDQYLAGQYRRAANLAFKSIYRWQRDSGPFKGSFYITKNHFDPKDRIGYQPASQWGNYTGALVQHLAEAWISRKNEIPEFPSPAEIGGYAFTTDDSFGAFFANAGGFQVMVNLRGASVPKYGLSWTPLGTVRMVKQGWDGRLGPSDGEHDISKNSTYQMKTDNGTHVDSYGPQSGISFGPEWKERGHWVRIADVPSTYRAEAEIKFVHPLLVRFTIHYTYVTGRGGPYFSQEFILTPDLLVTRLKNAQSHQFGLTVPLLENDGRPLITSISNNIAQTGYSKNGDQQSFIGLNKDIKIVSDAPSIQSTYGWLKPIRFESEEESIDLMVYPKISSDMSSSKMHENFKWTANGFTTPLAEIKGNLYRGINIAGGEGDAMDLDADGKSDVVFSKKCRFMLQLNDNSIDQVETDQDVIMTYQGKNHTLTAFQPFTLN